MGLEVLAYRTYWGRNREGGVEGELGKTGLWSRWLCARWRDWMCLLEIVTVTVTVTGDSCGSYVNHGKGEGRRQDARMRWHRWCAIMSSVQLTSSVRRKVCSGRNGSEDGGPWLLDWQLWLRVWWGISFHLEHSREDRDLCVGEVALFVLGWPCQSGGDNGWRRFRDDGTIIEKIIARGLSNGLQKWYSFQC